MASSQNLLLLCCSFLIIGNHISVCAPIGPLAVQNKFLGELKRIYTGLCSTFITVIPAGSLNTDVIFGKTDEFQYVIVTDQILTQFDRQNSVSPTERELYPHELMHPSIFSTFRHIPQCSTITVPALTVKSAVVILEYLVHVKLARANRDIFIIYGNRHALNDLRHAAIFNYITYRHLVYTESDSSALKLVNICPAKSALTLQKSTFPTSNGCQSLVAGKHLAVGGVPLPWFRVSVDTRSQKVYSGSFVTMLEEASARLNFTYSLKSLAGTGKKVNGTWYGAVGSLYYYDSDLVLTVATSYDRNFVIEGTDLLYWIHKVFWVRVYLDKQSPKSALRPFTPSAWATILLSLAILTVALHCFQEYEVRHQERTNRGYSMNYFSWKLPSPINTVGRTVLEQGVQLRHSQSNYTRFIVFLLFTFTLVTLTGYRSKLLGVLMFKDPLAVPRTFKELAFSQNYEKLIQRSYGGVARAALFKSQNPIHQAMRQEGRLEFVPTSDECAKQLASEDDGVRSACIDYDVFGEYAIATNATIEPPTRGEVNKIFKRSINSDGEYICFWGFRQRSPLKDVFHPLVATILQAGLLDRWYYTDLAKQRRVGIRYIKEQGDPGFRAKLESIQQEISEDAVKPIPLNAVKVSIVVLTVGLSLGIMFFIGEFSMKRKKYRLVMSTYSKVSYFLEATGFPGTEWKIISFHRS